MASGGPDDSSVFQQPCDAPSFVHKQDNKEEEVPTAPEDNDSPPKLEENVEAEAETEAKVEALAEAEAEAEAETETEAEAKVEAEAEAKTEAKTETEAEAEAEVEAEAEAEAEAKTKAKPEIEAEAEAETGAEAEAEAKVKAGTEAGGGGGGGDSSITHQEAPALEVAKSCSAKRKHLVGSTTDELEEDEHRHHVAKKQQTGADGNARYSASSASVDIDMRIKQAAEMMIILSGLGQIRAGRPPTEIEREIMAKAQQQIGYLAGKLLIPKDLVSREAVENMIEDLGLNKLKDQHKTAGPIKSIAERASDAMKKLEQARLSTMSTAMISSSSAKAEHAPVNVTINGSSVALKVQGAQAGPGKFSVSIAEPLPLLQSYIPTIPIIAQAPLAQPVTIEMRTPVVTTSVVVPHTRIAPTSVAATQAQVSLMVPVAAPPSIVRAEDRSQMQPGIVSQPSTTLMSSVSEAHLLPAQTPVLRPLAASGTTSERKSVPPLAETLVAISRDHPKSSMISPSKVSPFVQTTSISSTNIGKGVDIPVQASRKIDSNCGVTGPVQFEQKEIRSASMPVASHNLQTMQIPPQGQKPPESLAIRANHTDIARNVQKILQSKPPDFRQWEPPSKAYMNAPVTCQVCKISVTDVDTILVCDSCEKGVHLKCLQAYNQRGIPKGEWHCPKCLVASNGRPLPPKYGRVGKSSLRRTPASANKNNSQASTAKKMETAHAKSLQCTVVSNGLNTTPEIPIHVDLTHSDKTHSNNRRMSQETGDTIGDLKPNSEIPSAQSMREAEDGPNQPVKQELSAETPHMFTSHLETLSENENHHSPNNAVSLFGNQQSAHNVAASLLGSHHGSKDSQFKPQTNINLHSVTQLQTLSNSQGADRSTKQQAANASGNVLQSTSIQRLPVKVKEMPFFQVSEGQTSEDGRDDLHQEGKDAQQKKLHQTSLLKSTGEGTNQSRVTEEEDAYHVEWIGEKSQVLEGKTYYQSCCVKGVFYKLHDYALFRPETPNVPPYIAKLQDLWEDDDTGSKWVRVNWCYYPNDIPQEVGRPTTPEKDEVYESNLGDSNLVGSIQGPCQVLSPEKYTEEIEKRRALLKGGHEIGAFHPVFLCKWFYDTQKGMFRPVTP